MKKYIAPLVEISNFDIENILTASGVETTNTYAAYTLNVAMYNNANTDSTSTFRIGDLLSNK